MAVVYDVFCCALSFPRQVLRCVRAWFRSELVNHVYNVTVLAKSVVRLDVSQRDGSLVTTDTFRNFPPHRYCPLS